MKLFASLTNAAKTPPLCSLAPKGHLHQRSVFISSSAPEGGVFIARNFAYGEDSLALRLASELADLRAANANPCRSAAAFAFGTIFADIADGTACAVPPAISVEMVG
jgi:hypothetical protein